MYTLCVKSIIGQPGAIQSLRNAVIGGRQHHAWIFSGPFGVGKYTTAIGFSELLLGSNGVDHKRDMHIIKKEDVVWSTNTLLQRRKQTNIPLDLLRERMIGGRTSDGKKRDSVAYKTPVSGKRKVFIIDEAELLDEGGQNALLKTLEEPPVGTIIILVTCREDLLLPTIRSRCQTVCFSPLDEESMNKWVGVSGINADSADLDWSLSFSGGSPGLVCEAIGASLPNLAQELSRFLDVRDIGDYSGAVLRLNQFVEQNVTGWLHLNPNMSKDSANKRAMNLILLMFGLSARRFIRGSNPPLGSSLAGILVDIEGKLSTNISIKVLLESLCARWSNQCVGDGVFM